ncbi:MAG: hypothetical protein AAGF11_08145 [Myxococcota bacterium]
MEIARWSSVLSAALTIGSTGCALEIEDPEELDIELRSWGAGGRLAPPSEDDESRSGVGEWINNGLIDPAVSGVSVDHPLVSSQGLDNEHGWLADEDNDGVVAIRYMIECALDQWQSIEKTHEGHTTIFYGRLGLAPQWKNGSCDLHCQRWVSACMMARTNPVGQTTSIWLQGDHPALGFGNVPQLPNYEGAYYGNLFASTQVERSCQGSAAGLAAAADFGRTCASNESDCGFVSDGDCILDADCDLSDDGLLPVACLVDPAQPDYPVISVHVGDAAAE